MRAVVWQGKERGDVVEVPVPRLRAPTDAIVQVTSSAICGSDLHLSGVLAPFMHAGDIVGHEAIGIVTDVGEAVTHIGPGDRVVIPFQIACGYCRACLSGAHTQCETTQVPEYRAGSAIFGYSSLYGRVPGAQAEYVRVPHADFGPIKVPDDGEPDERYLFLSDVLPTAWQAVQYAEVPAGGTVLILGLGPIGQMASRIARFRGARRVVGADYVPERLAMAQRHGVETIDIRAVNDVADAVVDVTGDTGPDSVIDADGMEAHGSLAAAATQTIARLSDGPRRPHREHHHIGPVGRVVRGDPRRSPRGTVLLAPDYGDADESAPLLTMFDNQLTIRMGQADVHRWVGDLLPLVTDPADPLGVLDLRTHRLPLDQAHRAYDLVRTKTEGCVKVVFDPAT